MRQITEVFTTRRRVATLSAKNTIKQCMFPPAKQDVADAVVAQPHVAEQASVPGLEKQ
jgi:hypothetical protein